MTFLEQLEREREEGRREGREEGRKEERVNTEREKTPLYLFVVKLTRRADYYSIPPLTLRSSQRANTALILSLITKAEASPIVPKTLSIRNMIGM